MESRIVLGFEMKFGLDKQLIGFEDKSWLEYNWNTLVYVELVADGMDIVECPTKRYKFIFYIG